MKEGDAGEYPPRVSAAFISPRRNFDCCGVNLPHQWLVRSDTLVSIVDVIEEQKVVHYL